MPVLRLRIRVLFPVLAAALAAGLLPGIASASPSRPVLSARTPAAAPKAEVSLPVRHVRPVPPGDEIVVGRGDADGWHLYAASTVSHGQWQPLATLAPPQANPDGQTWIGRQCLTGDGRYVVAVVAPWLANNSPTGMDRGGIAYVVDAHTGAVRPLVAGVSLYYYTPSCGTGSLVALTRYAGSDERTSQVAVADAATAEVRSVQTVAGELTGAAPAPGGAVIAASGATIVRVSGGRQTRLASVAGQPFDLVANAAGGVDFLLGQGRTATLWTAGPRGAHQVGTGDFDRLALFPGRSGHTVATGVNHIDPTSAITTLPATAAAPEAVSQDASMTAEAPTAAPTNPGSVPRLPLRLRDAGTLRGPWTPDAAAPATTVMPAALSDSGGLPAPTKHVALNRSLATTQSGNAPYRSDCAVARNDVYLQTMQPTAQMIDWVAHLAGNSQLAGQYARPANYANLNLPSGYSPSLDFPLAAPFGPDNGGKNIPGLVLDAIFAQESNFKQASPHSLPGTAGNPYIADYYAAGGGYQPGAVTDSTGAPNPDCGYGLGQVTSGMRTGQMSYDLQRKVAVDYAENAAAAAQILSQKWKELADAGITANNSDPAILENWYLALWDYNSGLHPDNGGTWGLGWTNNPASPAYPYNRHPFLHTNTNAPTWSITYDDAAHPGDWPYQEKILGWMQVPIKDVTSGHFSYVGTLAFYNGIANVARSDYYELAQPRRLDFCDNTKNQCDPAVCDKLNPQTGENCDPDARQGIGPCTLSSLQCWWHYPATWCNVINNVCHGESPNGTIYNGASEPQTGTPYQPVCDMTPPAGALIVDSQPNSVNLQGCDPAGAHWHSSGSFGFTFGDPRVSGSQQTDMDLHQLGAGLGGHIWFTHTNEPTDSTGVSLWGATGTWAPNLARGRYDVKTFVPDAGATATEANYTVDNGAGLTHTVTVNQNASDGWVSLGKFWLGPGAHVSLTNLNVTSGGDLAFSAVEFVPLSAGRYVMLGDSYSSGEGAGSYDLDTNNHSTPQGINNSHRSTAAYPRVFAARTSSFGAVTDPRDPARSFDHVACSGALVPDYYSTNPTGTCPNEPGQHVHLTADTSLVTLTFGGNDLNFAPIVQDCVYAGLQDIAPATRSILKYPYATCREKWDAQLRQDITDLSAPTSSTGLVNLYRQIIAEAPNAEVVVLGYPHLVRPSTEPNGRCTADGAMLDGDRDWLNDMASRLDAAIASAAQSAGVDYISVDGLFTGHELCTPDPYLTGILDPTTNDTYPGEASFLQSAGLDKQQYFHPNINGYAAEAAALQQAIPVP